MACCPNEKQKGESIDWYASHPPTTTKFDSTQRKKESSKQKTRSVEKFMMDAGDWDISIDWPL